jgi:hypothetical protein
MNPSQVAAQIALFGMGAWFLMMSFVGLEDRPRVLIVMRIIGSLFMAPATVSLMITAVLG